MLSCLKIPWHSVCEVPKPKEPGLKSIPSDMCGTIRGEEAECPLASGDSDVYF